MKGPSVIFECTYAESQAIAGWADVRAYIGKSHWENTYKVVVFSEYNSSLEIRLKLLLGRNPLIENLLV